MRLHPARYGEGQQSGKLASVILAAVAALFLLAACSGSSESESSTSGSQDWDDVLAEADGQTVQLWMWGGDSVLNAYIENEVAPRVAAQGVTLEQIRLDDTADGIARIVSEIEAGSSDGAVDLLWVNGKNFAQGKEAGLWAADWVSGLPNASLLEPSDTTLFNDFGVTTDGQEAPWSRAAFTFVYDTTRLTEPPGTFDELAQWVAANPGRFTYPAPPDFTGSAFVRQAVQELGEDEAFEMLSAMTPDLWSAGSTYPKDETELNALFANGEVDLAMSYNPNVVHVNVEQGLFPASARPFVFEQGTLQNVSFLAMPANAGSSAGAKVAMNEMLTAELQALKLEQVGVPSVVHLSPEVIAAQLSDSPYRLTDYGTPLQELPASAVPAIDERWLTEVLS